MEVAVKVAHAVAHAVAMKVAVAVKVAGHCPKQEEEVHVRPHVPWTHPRTERGNPLRKMSESCRIIHHT